MKSHFLLLSHYQTSAPARIKSPRSSQGCSQSGSPLWPREAERPAMLTPARRPGGEGGRAKEFPAPPSDGGSWLGSVAGNSDHRPAVLPVYLVHHHQPARLAVHLPCKHHQLLHPQVCRTAVSNHNHHLSRRGSTATILHQHPQQSRDLNNYQNYQENKNHQLAYLVPRRSSCDPEDKYN